MTDERAEEPVSVDVVRKIAKVIHDARCGSSNHRTPKVYERCIDFYMDHAELALSGLWEAGFEVVRRER